jgi:hypothetical protein
MATGTILLIETLAHAQVALRRNGRDRCGEQDRGEPNGVFHVACAFFWLSKYNESATIDATTSRTHAPRPIPIEPNQSHRDHHAATHHSTIHHHALHPLFSLETGQARDRTSPRN